MKNDEVGLFGHASSFDDCDEDGDQFVALGTKRLQFGCWHEVSVGEKVQPIGGLLQLFERISTFRDELGLAPSAVGFPVVRTDGSSRAKQLFAQHLGFGRFWQASEESDDSQRKLLRAVLEIVFYLHHSDFQLAPWWR